MNNLEAQFKRSRQANLRARAECAGRLKKDLAAVTKERDELLQFAQDMSELTATLDDATLGRARAFLATKGTT